MAYPTQFILDNGASDGTSNLTNLLNESSQQALRLIMPRDLEKVFGPGDELCYDQSKGYTDPEWYFRSSDGCVWGVGWRWGNTRLRGRGATSRGNMFYNRPPVDSAHEFLEFLMKSLDQS